MSSETACVYALYLPRRRHPEMAPLPPLPLALGRFKQLAQRSTKIWQGGLVRLPLWIDNATDPAGPPYRPTGAFWVSLRTGLVHLELPPEGATASPEFALTMLLNFGLKESKSLGGRPAIIQVRDAQVKERLSTALSGLGTAVELVEDLPAVRAALRDFEGAAGNGRRLPGVLEARGVTVERLRAFADAAVCFYDAEPWQHLTNEDLIIVEAPAAPRGMKHLVVLGNGGQRFGLAFFESRKAFERVFASSRSTPPRRAHGVTFGSIDELPFADVDAWEDHALPVAGHQAYPLAADLRLDGTMLRPDARELAYIEGLLRALTVTTQDELDAGNWRHSVSTFDGTVILNLTLPLLLDGEQGRPVHPRFEVMLRVAERSSVRLTRFFEGRTFDNLDEANAAMDAAREDGLFEQTPEIAAGRALTALEQAQEFAHDAMEATGRLQIKLARRALSISEDCADAHVILGDASSNVETARDWYQRAVDAGARALGPDRFASLAGEFWGHLETRPYMRARLALAQTLFDLGQRSQALDHYRELLRLNPNDNQGVRWLLLPALLEDGLNEEAGRLLAQYEGDLQATWPYAQALLLFRAEGDTTPARAALTNALRVNPHAAKYLLNPERVPIDRPPHFALGSAEEGASVAEGLHAAFECTPGALAWLRVNAAHTSRPRPRRRVRTRPRRR